MLRMCGAHLLLLVVDGLQREVQVLLESVQVGLHLQVRVVLAELIRVYVIETIVQKSVIFFKIGDGLRTHIQRVLIIIRTATVRTSAIGGRLSHLLQEIRYGLLREKQLVNSTTKLELIFELQSFHFFS